MWCRVSWCSKDSQNSETDFIFSFGKMNVHPGGVMTWRLKILQCTKNMRIGVADSRSNVGKCMAHASRLKRTSPMCNSMAKFAAWRKPPNTYKKSDAWALVVLGHTTYIHIFSTKSKRKPKNPCTLSLHSGSFEMDMNRYKIRN